MEKTGARAEAADDALAAVEDAVEDGSDFGSGGGERVIVQGR